MTETKSALAAQLLGVNPARAAPPGELESLTKAITAINENRGSDVRYAKALELLKAGKTGDDATLLEGVAKDARDSATRDQKRAADAFRSLGAIAGVADPKKAREAYAEAARLDPDNIEGMYWHGYFAEDAGDLAEAETAYRRMITLGTQGRDDSLVYWAHLGLGNTQRARGDLGAARAEYDLAQMVADRLVKSDPGNAGWQRDLSVSFYGVGDVQLAQGNLPEALKSYRDSLAISDRLAKSEPGNAEWQRNLSVSFDRVGNVQVAQGNLPEALKSYRDSLAIRDRLARSDPGNAEWQRNLSVSYAKLARVLRKTNASAEALRALLQGQEIIARMTQLSPDNADWKNDLTWFNDQIAQIKTLR